MDGWMGYMLIIGASIIRGYTGPTALTQLHSVCHAGVETAMPFARDGGLPWMSAIFNVVNLMSK